MPPPSSIILVITGFDRSYRSLILGVFPEFATRERRKPTIILRRNTLFPCRDLNPGSSEYYAENLPTMLLSSTITAACFIDPL
jgi:hypothetical protein